MARSDSSAASAELDQIATLAERLGYAVERDPDGDLLVETGAVGLLVCQLPDLQVLQIATRLLHDICDPKAASVVTSAATLASPLVAFTVADHSVLAVSYICSSPLLPAHATRVLSAFVDTVERVVADLHEALGGLRDVRPGLAGSSEGLPPELAELLELDPQGAGLPADQTAAVCGHDQALARQLLHIAERQADAWAAAGARSDDTEHGAQMKAEAAGWRATVASLSAALDLIESD